MTTASTSDLSGFFEILQQLVREPSVVGTEDSFFRVLRRELEEVDVRVERNLGVLVAQGSQPESLILSAHIDRHGLLCTGPNEFQYTAFIAGNRGELTGDSVSEQMMASIADRFTGQRVQAHLPYTGTYLGQGLISKSYLCPKRHNLIFEIDGLEYLQPGAPVSFLDRLHVNETHLSAQLDNVLSVALIVQSTKTFGELETLIQANAATAEESASISKEMQHQAGQLAEVIDRLQSIVSSHGSTPENNYRKTGSTPSPSKNRIQEEAFSWN